MCPEDYEPFGGCIYWSEKNQEGIVSSEAAAEEEENCELYFTNCTFSHNSLDTNIYFDQTKGGAVYLAFHSQTFPFVFQEVALFQNKANIGRDIFIRCPSISDKGESQKFGVNFNHSLWNEKNSIGAESEKEGKVVDYLEFITYRNSVIYVSGMEDSTKKFRSELLSSSASCLSCTSLRCMNDEYSKDKGGWDIFFCGSKDDPCRTVNYAMTHLSTFSSSPSTTQEAHDSSGNNSYFERRIRSLEKEEEQPSLHIIGEVYLINSVTWISIIIEGDTEGAGLKLESIWNEVNREEGIKQQAKLREGSRTTDYHVAIKGNCKMNNTNVKINADLPVSCLFLINDESAFEIERCAISSAKQETTSPTFLKIETGTLLCVLLSLSKVLFYRGSFFIDCSGIDEKSKVRVELKDCCFKEIKVSDQKSLIVFSIKEQNFIENNENQHTFEHSSSSSSLSSIPSDIPSFQHNISLSSLPSRISTCIRNSSIPVNISLQLIRTNISLSSRSAGKGFFLAASGCSAVHIQDCCFFYVDLASSANDKQKNTENAICMWDSSFVSFVNSSVDMQNTTFRTKLVGAIDSKNSYLSIDVASMKGNSIELDGFPSVAHNIICRSDETKKEGKGVIELVNDAGSSIYSKHSAKSEKRRIFEETYEELPDNFWIENNNCSLTGFPNDLMSCLFTPLPENVSKMIVGEGCEVQLTGKYLFNCYLMMRILANKTSGGKVLTELTEIAVTENLSSSSENAISAFFSRDVVERSNGAEVFAVLKFFDDRSLMKEQETYPLRVSDGKDLGRADNASTVMIIVVSTVIPTVGIGFIILLLFVRKKWKEKRRIAEYNENENLLNSINSDFSEITANKRENPRYLNFVNDYGTLAKLIDIPSDSQEPYLED
ncbi:uncharacterized protein MONOS_9788 [Monocercomonoides exilis]|uniref:uncharacterized protein n=1 Tax=Monocercomonoides exilis TaxID=2049356 RepID=UPI00355A5968|nr:hypothetical protein MONOS_9788 [Monocercomonoides exilis]|eukprot:MONOS_9788.1-p1 / transcript=MONOS_9788.1 / gene=MONOS_9788 / organism=Monocercomonoides_exilis_PA203 / gene_product=unspecified product / transcript_product=unspecified product / location=Mono_scaffold00417:27514-30174(-) / protein_length=887 / sequence_SO=supercontig / SO=protein_coding / is_pseudo=false